MDAKSFDERSIIVTTKSEMIEALIFALSKYNELGKTEEQDQVLYTKKEAAKRMRVSYNTLMKRIKDGFIKVRSDGRIPKSSIDLYLSL
jgi:excisionase family DNA binding protein